MHFEPNALNYKEARKLNNWNRFQLDFLRKRDFLSLFEYCHTVINNQYGNPETIVGLIFPNPPWSIKNSTA